MPFSSNSEKDLIASIKKGDEASYKLVYLNLYEQLCSYIFNFTKDSSEAEDIVQETFVKLWTKRTSLNIDGALKAYLYRMAYNLFIDTYNKNKKMDKALEAFQFNSLLELINDDETIYQEKLKNIENAINELPPKCKEIFVLSKKDNMRYKDIASHLNISIKTVENQVSKALSLIRKKVNSTLILFLLRHKLI